MTQVKSAQRAGKKLASTARARNRTLAQRRADLEEQIRSRLAADPTMALTEPEQVRARMKELHQRAGVTQLEVATALNVPYRTLQSWVNAEVETDRANYEKLAAYYSKRLKRKVTANWILFGQDQEPPLSTPDFVGTMNNGVPEDLQAQLNEIKAAQARAEKTQARTEQKLNELADLIAEWLATGEEPESPPAERRATG